MPTSARFGRHQKTARLRYQLWDKPEDVFDQTTGAKKRGAHFSNNIVHQWAAKSNSRIRLSNQLFVTLHEEPFPGYITHLSSPGFYGQYEPIWTLLLHSNAYSQQYIWIHHAPRLQIKRVMLAVIYIYMQSAINFVSNLELNIPLCHIGIFNFTEEHWPAECFLDRLSSFYRTETGAIPRTAGGYGLDFCLFCIQKEI